jgi:hypothetical protein
MALCEVLHSGYSFDISELVL